MNKSLDDRPCSRCAVVKPIEDFARNPHYSNGRRGVCKKCVALQTRSIYNRNPEAKLEKNEVYRKDNWKEILVVRSRRVDPYKNKARQAVGYAVKTGKFEKKACQECGEPRSQFHHSNGYDKDNWFTGMWLCSKHHHKLHKELRWQTT